VPHPRALGLRGRIVGAVLVTTVVTLLVAALAILGPLENKLKQAEFSTFKDQVGPATAAQFANLYLGQKQAKGDLTLLLQAALSPATPTKSTLPSEAAYLRTEAQLQRSGQRAKDHLVAIESQLASRLGASEVAILGLPDSAGNPKISVHPLDEDLASSDFLQDAIHVFRSHTTAPRYSKGSLDGSEYARATVPFTTPSPVIVQPGVHQGHVSTAPARWVLVVRKPFANVTEAVATVRTAVLDAAVAALALVLLLAIPLASRVVRRLRRLRHAALELAEHGPSVEIPVDRVHDEVGDLARTFALMQTQLRNQEEARRAFVATASHELRTPLTSLEGMLELVEDDLAGADPDLEDARSLLQRSRAQARRLSRLAADLLDLSRIDAQVQLRSEPVELGELSRAVMAEFELGTGERQLRCELHDGGKPVWALGDPGSVARILRILLDNAVHVSTPRSEITVELHGGERASLSVCDEGPGVPPEDRNLIFERFQRGHATGGQAGFGLGLAIGRELAQRMGGELVLEDSEVGAKFTLRLPAAAAPAQDPLSVV